MKKRIISFLTSFALAAGMTAMPVSAEAGTQSSAVPGTGTSERTVQSSETQTTEVINESGIGTDDVTDPLCTTTAVINDVTDLLCTTTEPVCTTVCYPTWPGVDTAWPGAAAVYQWRSGEITGSSETETYEWFTDTLPDRLLEAAPTLSAYNFHSDYDLLLVTLQTKAQDVVFCEGVFVGPPSVRVTVLLKNPSDSGENTLKAYRIGIVLDKDENASDRSCNIVCSNYGSGQESDYEFMKQEALANGVILLTYTGSGDLNGDGDMNIGDAVLLTRLITEDETLDISVLSLREADLNADGLTDARDLSRMLRMLASPGAPPDEPENDPEAQTTEPCETSGTHGNDLTTASEETSGTPGNDLTTVSEETSGTPGNDLTTVSDNTDEGIYTYTYTSFFPEWTLLSQETETVTESEAAYTDTDTPAAPEPVVFRLVPHGLDFAQRSELDSTGHGLPSICWIRPGASVTVDLTVENDPGTAGMQLYFNFDKALTFERRKNSTDAYQVNVTWNPQDYSYVWTSANGKNQTAADGALMSSFVFRVPEENGTYLLDLNYAAERPNCVRPESGLTVPDTPFVFHGLKIVVGGETELTDAPEVSETCENTDDWPLYTNTYSCDETGEYPWDQSGEGEFCFTTDQPFLAGAEVVLEWENLCNCDDVIPTEESWEWFTDTLPDWLNAETPMLADYDFHSEYDLLLITLESRCKDAAFVWGDFVSSGINNPTVSAMFSYLDVPSDEQLPQRTARFGVVRPKDPNPPELLLTVEFCREESEALFAQRKAGSAPFVRRE